MKQILQSLESRLAWYEKALAMYSLEIDWEHGFDWPHAPGIACPPVSNPEWENQYIMYLSGCIHELHNTIDMLNAKEGIKPCLTSPNP